MRINDVVQLMLKSSDNNPYSGNLSREQNVLAAIELARLCKDFADKGQVDEAMNISCEMWADVIKELESLKN